jgi:hypothetical protein
MKNKFLAILAVGLMTGPIAAQAGIVTVDFEDPGLAAGTANGTFGGFSVSSNGCAFTTSAAYSGLENGVDGSDNGTTHLFGSDVTMTCGGVFDLVSWDMAEDYEALAIYFLIDLVYADGSSLTQGGTLDGAFGFQTWSNCCDAGLNLLSVRWYTNDLDTTGGIPAQFALDNIRVNVPEPSTLALLGLGLLGLGLGKRRKTA